MFAPRGGPSAINEFVLADLLEKNASIIAANCSPGSSAQVMLVVEFSGAFVLGTEGARLRMQGFTVE